MKTERFNHPTLHVIDADSQRVLWHEPHGSSTWYPDRATLTRGSMQYRIVRQQPEVNHYYVWVDKLEN